MRLGLVENPWNGMERFAKRSGQAPSSPPRRPARIPAEATTRAQKKAPAASPAPGLTLPALARAGRNRDMNRAGYLNCTTVMLQGVKVSASGRDFAPSELVVTPLQMFLVDQS
ncbi:hypothetical protein MCBRY_003950 [Methylocystis bryophila]